MNNTALERNASSNFDLLAIKEVPVQHNVAIAVADMEVQCGASTGVVQIEIALRQWPVHAVMTIGAQLVPYLVEIGWVASNA